MAQITRKTREYLIYTSFWMLIFAIPVMTIYIRRQQNPVLDFNWQEVFRIWQVYAIYFALFFLHNFLLAPLVVYKRRRGLYAVLVTALIIGFGIFQFASRPIHKHNKNRVEMRAKDGQPPLPPDVDKHETATGNAVDKSSRYRNGKIRPRRLMFIDQVDVISIIVLILMLGMNISVKLIFKQDEEAKKLHQLQKESLEQQLQYLKFQINPHFFMNTLNNIHALVDIDPERAKDSIVVLSKMMRYILYEGNNKFIPLDKELECIRNYICLMKMRYTERVKITVSMPARAENCEIPPLMLITFVENAFKHGVSYCHESYIDMAVNTNNEHIVFSCRNSKAVEANNKETGGVGLKNVRKRLDLIYRDSYQLTFHDDDNSYGVELVLPVRCPS